MRMIPRQIKRFGFWTFSRSFNWKYPFPRHLQPSPPEEKIDPNNLLELSDTLSENESYNKEFINKNPRNLEQMLFEQKPLGFPLDKPSVTYWNKIVLKNSSKNTSAKVIHNSGRTVVSASTQEWAIRKHLYSAVDINAVVNVAHVLTRRCLESGIQFVHFEYSNQRMDTERIHLFLKCIEEGGLKIGELDSFRPDNYWFDRRLW